MLNVEIWTTLTVAVINRSTLCITSRSDLFLLTHLCVHLFEIFSHYNRCEMHVIKILGFFTPSSSCYHSKLIYTQDWYVNFTQPPFLRETLHDPPPITYGRPPIKSKWQVLLRGDWLIDCPPPCKYPWRLVICNRCANIDVGETAQHKC